MAWVTILAATAAAVGLLVRWRPGRKTRLPRIGEAPHWWNLGRLKQEFNDRGHEMVAEGYEKFGDSAFLVQTADMERIVLSNKYVDEIRAAPESQLSVRLGMVERHLGRYTTLDVILQSHLQNDVCKGQLTQNLDRILREIVPEAQQALNELIPPESDTMIPAYELVLHTITRMTSRAFVGEPMCRDAEWLQTAKAYTGDVFAVSTALRPYPKLLRPLAAWFVAPAARVKAHVEVAQRKLVPLLERRTVGGGRVEMLQWMVDAASGADRNPARLASKMLFLTLAALHTSSMGATHALLDLCAMPEYLQPFLVSARRIA